MIHPKNGIGLTAKHAKERDTMPSPNPWSLFLLVNVIFPEWVCLATAMTFLLGFGPSAMAEKKSTQMEARNLPDLIRALPAQFPPVGSKFRLAPEWVGTVRRVSLRGGEGIYKDDKPEDIRLTHAWVTKSKDGPLQFQIARVRTRPNGGFSYVGNEAPIYKAKLPTAREVSEFTKLNELRKVFGTQHGWTDGWGDGTGMNWTEGWTWFTFEKPTQLRYLNIFAHIHGVPAAKDADIQILLVREGTFRPMNLESAEEREKFKTGEELAARERRERVAENEKYPSPLRSLVAAQHAPDDSDLAAYTRALNEFRREPSAELLRQVVAQMSDGAVEFQMMFEDLLIESHRFLKLNKWQREPRKTALRAGVEALSAAKSPMVFDQTLARVLDALGGGKLNFNVPATNATVSVAVERTANSESQSFGSTGITAQNLTKVIEATQQRLRKAHPELWPPESK